ncbi:DUF805 domain-containing protein [Rhodobacterales bacterium HKCCSP123]|nr:DUF805 domain-containing protein [Rhodobacterales bacterium HKCCSP123]
MIAAHLKYCAADKSASHPGQPQGSHDQPREPIETSLLQPATEAFAPLFQLATILPLLAAGWRQLYDAGRLGWNILLPTIFSVAFMLALLVGVFAFGAMEAAGASPVVLRGPAILLSTVGLMVSAAIQLVLAILMLWWLTPPSEPGANSYGKSAA